MSIESCSFTLPLTSLPEQLIRDAGRGSDRCKNPHLAGSSQTLCHVDAHDPANLGFHLRHYKVHRESPSCAAPEQRQHPGRWEVMHFKVGDCAGRRHTQAMNRSSFRLPLFEPPLCSLPPTVSPFRGSQRDAIPVTLTRDHALLLLQHCSPCQDHPYAHIHGIKDFHSVQPRLAGPQLCDCLLRGTRRAPIAVHMDTRDRDTKPRLVPQNVQRPPVLATLAQRKRRWRPAGEEPPGRRARYRAGSCSRRFVSSIAIARRTVRAE